MEFPFRTSTPSQSEIFSLKSVIVACLYRISFQDQYTLPKWYILLQSCYYGLLYVFVFQDQHTLPKWNILSNRLWCLFLSAPMYVLFLQDQHTFPKWNILSNLLLWLVCMEFPVTTSTPSQSEIFSLIAVIVACSNGVSFHTLPKRNILSKLLFWLVHMEFPFVTSTPSQSEIFSQNYFCCFFISSHLISSQSCDDYFDYEFSYLFQD